MTTTIQIHRPGIIVGKILSPLHNNGSGHSWEKGMKKFPCSTYMRLFAYGTLREGGKYHHLIAESIRFEKTISLGGYRMYDDGRGYPLLVMGTRDDLVLGDIFLLFDPDGSLLDTLDELEGATEDLPPPLRLYRRELIETEEGSAWAYLYNGDIPPAAKVISDWLK